jgi:FAD/FMN-containing dehydrogenase
MNPTAMTTQTSSALSRLVEFRAKIRMPGDPDWRAARSGWNLPADQYPAAVAFPVDAHDVAMAIDFARERGLGVCVQGAEHDASASGPLGGSLLIKTERMREGTIDAAS